MQASYRDLFKNKFLRLFSIIFIFVILEIIAGFFYKNLPKDLENGKKVVEAFLGKEDFYQNNQISPHPYLLYVNTPNYFAHGIKQHNSLGYRDDECTIEKPKNTIRILALGGSTVYGNEIEDPNDVWVDLLEKKLQTLTNKKINVINAGLSGATTAEMLSSYMFRHRYLNPDLVIVETGVTDMMAAFFPGYNPEYTHFRAPGQNLKARPFEKFLLKSNIFKLIYARWLNSSNLTFEEIPSALKTLDRKKALERVKKNNGLGFRRNLECLIQMIKNDGAQVILIGPYGIYMDSDKTDPRYVGWSDHFRILYLKYVKIEKVLAEKYKMYFLTLVSQRWDVKFM